MFPITTLAQRSPSTRQQNFERHLETGRGASVAVS